MTHKEAVEFLHKGIESKQGIWLDLGAGSGVFSKALAEILPSGSKIYAVDKNKSVLNISNPISKNEIIAIQTDFEELPEFSELDGILMANALHYIKTPIPFLQILLKKLRPKGSFVLIEYDLERGNPWVPFPVSFKKWQTVSRAAGLSIPTIFSERVSSFGQGTMYAALNYLEHNLDGDANSF